MTVSAPTARRELRRVVEAAGLYYTGRRRHGLRVAGQRGELDEPHDAIPGLPKFAAVARVAPSSHDEGTAYATFDNHREDDYRPYVYISTDFGMTWRAITAGIPDGQAVRTINEDLKNPNVLYLGTEFGLFVSLNKGGQWMRVKANLPTVPIAEITLHPRDNDMILATHGRSIWILDDLTPFQQAPAAMAASAYLFDIRPATSFNPGSFRHAVGSPGDRRFWGKNPERGAAVSYYLGAPARDITARIRDGAGTVVRELSGDAFAEEKGAGIHRVQWDLRYQSVPDSLLPGGGGGRSGGAGPFVLPGDYRVTLSVDGREATARSVRVVGDPLSTITDADRTLMHDASLALHRLQAVAGEAAGRLPTERAGPWCARLLVWVERASAHVGRGSRATAAARGDSSRSRPARRRLRGAVVAAVAVAWLRCLTSSPA